MSSIPCSSIAKALITPDILELYNPRIPQIWSCWLRNPHWLLRNDVWIVDSTGKADHKYARSTDACVTASVVIAD